MRESTWFDWSHDQVEPLPVPSGCVLTVLKGDDVIVWLIGELDASIAMDLREIAEQMPGRAQRLVIDASRVSFSDSTVLRFIATMAASVPVTIRRPSRVFADLITISGLPKNPWIRNEPGAPQ
jgi:anti-anti-sigma regulatory factor